MPVLGIDASRAVKKEKTGVEWYSYFLLAAMRRCTPEGWRVKCYVPSPPPQSSPIKGEEGIGSPPPLTGGVRGGWKDEGDWQWRVLRWPGRGWTQARLSVEMMAHPPDVLFVPSHVIPLVHPERTITTVHDVVFLKYPELYDPADLENQKRGLDFALKFAKKIIVPSRAVREDLLAAGARGEQVAVVPHGVEIECKMQNEKCKMIKPPYILFIGRIEKKKNVLGLVQAFRGLIDADKLRDSSPSAQNDRLCLVLAGQLGYGGQDALQAIKTFKLEERVVHLGYVERARYQTLLQGAEALVFPSFGEGFGFPVLEAMSAGVPVICSDLPVLREVGGSAAQYVNPYDPQDIARGIQTVLENEMLRSEMIRAGKERAREFTWERSAQSTWEIIMSL